MAITFVLNDPVKNDQTAGLQTTSEFGDDLDTDVAFVALHADFKARLGTLGLAPVAPPDDDEFVEIVGAAKKLASVTVNSEGGEITALGFSGELDDNGTPADPSDDTATPLLAWTGVEDPTTGGATGLTTVDGETIYLFRDADAGLGDQMALGVDENGDIVFAVYMNTTFNADGSATIDFHMVSFEAIAHPIAGDNALGEHDDQVDLADFLTVSASENVVFNFAGTPSGKNLFTMVKANGVAIVVTNITELLVLNTSQGGGPTTLGLFNQMIDPGEEMVFTFVRDPVDNFTVPNLDQNEADDETKIQFNGYETIGGGSVFISQRQGGTLASLTLKARTEDQFTTGGDGFIEGYANDPFVNITRVIVKNAAGQTLVDTDTGILSGGGVTVNLDPGANDSWAFISGVDAGYDIIYEAGPHQRLSVLGEAGKFDIGGIGIDSPNAAVGSVGDNVIFDDDGPSAALATTAAVVTLDESVGADAGDPNADDGAPLANVTTPIATLFDDTSSFGTDGGRDADNDGTVDDDATTYSLVLNGVTPDSGLDDTATGESIFLFEDGGDIVGRVGSGGVADAGGAEAFRIIVSNDPDTVQVIQSRAVVHDDFPDDHDENDDPEMMDANLVLLRTTVVDDDGDTDSDDAELGSRIKFEDDGPIAAIAPEDVTFLIDETDNAGENAPNETDMISDGHLGSVTILGSNLFNHTGEDVGSDGGFDPARAYELELSAAGVDSGLVDTATGNAVKLFSLDAQTVIGVAGNLVTDPEVIRITVDSDDGDTTVTQTRAVVHDVASDPDESATPQMLDPNVLFLKYTLKDGDQDEDADQFDLGSLIKLEDDGPTVTVDADASGADLAALELEHDETIAPEAPDGEDTYNEPGSGADAPANRDNNGDLDDTGMTVVTVSTGPANAAAIGMLETDGSGEIGALFSVTEDFGSDGEGDLDTTDGRTDLLSLVLRDASGTPVDMLETNLKVTALEGTALAGLGEAARTIWLVQVDSTTVEGRIPGTDGVLGTGDDDFVAFRIELENETDLDLAKLVTHHFIPIDHGGTEDPSVFDEEAELATVDENATLSITLETTIEDGDDDTDTDDAFVPIVDNAGGFLAFDDDGPQAVITDEGGTVTHDESPGEQTGGVPNPDTGEDNNDDDQSDPLPAAFVALGAALGWAKSAAAVVSSTGTDFGTDGEAASDAEVWSLDVPADDTVSGFVTLDDFNILLNKEGGLIVGRIDAAMDGDVDLTDDVALAISIDQDGFLSIAQYVFFKHPDGNAPDEAVVMNDNALLAVLTVTDGDGDVHETTEPIGDKVIIEDHAPLASQQEPLPLQEDDLNGSGTQLSTGNNEDLSVDQHTGTINVEDGITDEGDPPVSYSIKNIDPDTVLPTLFSRGEAVDYTLTLAENKIEAFAGGRLVFTFTLIDNGDGTAEATLTLNDQLDHVPFGDDGEGVLLLTDPSDPVNTAVNAIDFTGMLELRDKDNDLVSLEADFVSYSVQDDVPIIAKNLDGSPNPIEGGTVDFEDGDTITRSLNGLIGTDENDADNEAGDGTKTYTFASFTQSFLIDRDGTENDVLIRGVLSADGTVVDYFEDQDGDPLTDDFGDQFYTISLDQDAGTYTFEVLKDPPPAFLEFDFTDLPSGNNLHGTIAADKSDLSGLGLLVFPKGAVLQGDGTYSSSQSTTLNTSKGGGPVTIGNSNQMIDPGEGMYFVFVSDPDDDSVAGVTGGLTQNTADDADTVGFADTFTSTTSSVEIVQVQGGSPASMDIFAWDIEFTDLPVGDNTPENESRLFVATPTTGDEISSATAKNITEVKVFDGLGEDATLIFHATESGGVLVGPAGITANFDDDKVRLTGIEDDYKIEFETDGGHDLVLVEGVAGKFDIGGFNIAEAQPTPDQLYQFEVAITDFDGDQDISNQFGITVDGTGPFDSGEHEDGTLVV